jgi:parallel beta-helix repeat protein
MYCTGENFLIDNNTISTTCIVVDDGGGIYTDVGTVSHSYNGRTISNNTVSNVPGAPIGANGIARGVGIYLDDNSSNVTVFNNTTYNCGWYGIYYHNSHEISSSNNISYNNGTQFQITHDSIVPSLPVNYWIKNNTLTAYGSQSLFSFKSIGSNSTPSDFTNWGYCDYNTYSASISNSSSFTTQLVNSSSVSRIFSNWQSFTTKDANSTYNLAITSSYPYIAVSYGSIIILK